MGQEQREFYQQMSRTEGSVYHQMRQEAAAMTTQPATIDHGHQCSRCRTRYRCTLDHCGKAYDNYYRKCENCTRTSVAQTHRLVHQQPDPSCDVCRKYAAPAPEPPPTPACHACGTTADLNIDGTGRYVCGTCLYTHVDPYEPSPAPPAPTAGDVSYRQGQRDQQAGRSCLPQFIDPALGAAYRKGYASPPIMGGATDTVAHTPMTDPNLRAYAKRHGWTVYRVGFLRKLWHGKYRYRLHKGYARMYAETAESARTLIEYAEQYNRGNAQY